MGMRVEGIYGNEGIGYGNEGIGYGNEGIGYMGMRVCVVSNTGFGCSNVSF